MNKWLKIIRSAVYPPSCRLCGQATSDESGLCPACIRVLPWLGASCRLCACPLPPGPAVSVCGACLQRPPPFQAAYAAWRYAAPIDALLQRLKYQGDLALARTCATLMRRALKPRTGLPPAALIPVPLHPRRLRARGFNQALELARLLARGLDIGLLPDTCQRTRDTPSQSELSRPQRRANVRGAFVLTRPLPVAHVAVVDDVLTTGATVRELARVLRGGGAERVEVWTCARAV